MHSVSLEWSLLMSTPALRWKTSAWRKWHQLKVVVNLAHMQPERTRADVGWSLAASREACIRAQEEVRAVEQRHEAAEEREKELRALNADLEWQVQMRQATPAVRPGGPLLTPPKLGIVRRRWHLR